jgi:hypothetical protein
LKHRQSKGNGACNQVSSPVFCQVFPHGILEHHQQETAEKECAVVYYIEPVVNQSVSRRVAGL